MKKIRNRIFAMALACAFCTTMSSMPAVAGSACTLGDADENGIVNAVDASQVLIKAAELGTGGTAASEELAVMDVNEDGQINVLDAAVILSYAADAGAGYKGTLEAYVSQRAEPEYYGAQYVSMLFGDIYNAFSEKTFLITSTAELEAFVDKMNEISECFDVRISTDAAEVCGVPLTDTVAKYDEAWFEEHDLIMVIAEEYATQIHHAVRGITENEDGSWTVSIDRLIPPASEQTLPSFAIFVETNKAVEFAPAVNVEMSTVYLEP